MPFDMAIGVAGANDKNQISIKRARYASAKQSPISKAKDDKQKNQQFMMQSNDVRLIHNVSSATSSQNIK